MTKQAAILSFGLILSLVTAIVCQAEPWPSSELLLPYFEVSLDPSDGVTTFFDVVNSGDRKVTVEVTVSTNWGYRLEALTQTFELEPRAVQVIDLGPWIRQGDDFVKAALTGKPHGGQYFSSAPEISGVATGYVEVRVLGQRPPQTLWGNCFSLDQVQNFARGDVLVHRGSRELEELCHRRALRFLAGGAFDGTQIIAWSPLRGEPSPTPFFTDNAANTPIRPEIFVGREALDGPAQDFLPLQVTTPSELRAGRFGWLDVRSPSEEHLSSRLSALARFSVGLPSYCLPGAGDGADVRPRPSSHLLLPLFEVDLYKENGRNTFFEVVNSDGAAVEAELRFYTNWGHELEDLRSILTLGAGGVQTIDIEDLLERRVENVDTEASRHLRAALTGQRSARGDRFYSSQLDGDANLAAGYVEIEAPGRPVLWGDYFAVDLANDFAQGDILANLDDASPARDLCERHGVRFLDGGVFDAGGTRITVWTPKKRQDGSSGRTLANKWTVPASVEVYDQEGRRIAAHERRFQPAERLSVSELLGGTAPPKPFGWIDVRTSEDDETFMAVRFTAGGRFSAGLMSHCLRVPDRRPGSEIPGGNLEVIVLLDGQPATGQQILVGEPLTWTYEVTNAGDAPVTDIEVTDRVPGTVQCEKDVLEPGEMMRCTVTGVAAPCRQDNRAEVTARQPDGTAVTPAADDGHYVGITGDVRIATETRWKRDGEPFGDAPKIPRDAPVEWRYRVTNATRVKLKNVTVEDSHGVQVKCKKSALAAGEVLDCFAEGTASESSYSNTGTVTATTDTACPEPKDHADPSGYDGIEGYFTPGIIIDTRVEKDGVFVESAEFTEGEQVRWRHRVINNSRDLAGNPFALRIGSVTDTSGSSVTCRCGGEDVARGVGCVLNDSIDCFSTHPAALGSHENEGTVTATPVDPTFGEDSVSDTNQAAYVGVRPNECVITVDLDSDPAQLVKGLDADFRFTLANRSGAGSGLIFDNVGITTNITDYTELPNSRVPCSWKREAGRIYPDSGLDTAECVFTARVPRAAELSFQARANSPCGEIETAPGIREVDDPAPDLRIETLTNGFDADAGPGPSIVVGDPVVWTYVLTNTGNVPFIDVVVSDDQAVSVSCPKNRLETGETMTCTANGTAQAGQYHNVGTLNATALPDNVALQASDPSHYFGVDTALDLTMKINGQEARTAPGPELEVGVAVTWTYEVENTGNSELRDVRIDDDQLGLICVLTRLAVGEEAACTASGTAEAGQHRNDGHARGHSSVGTNAEDHDWTYYQGQEPQSCGVCDGKVTDLTLRYLGSASADIRVDARRGPTTDEVFNATVAAGGTFSLHGPATGNPGFAGTLGTEIRIYVDGALATEIHTSCSVPIGPGFRSGDFLVTAGASRNGGDLCPL